MVQHYKTIVCHMTPPWVVDKIVRSIEHEKDLSSLIVGYRLFIWSPRPLSGAVTSNIQRFRDLSCLGYMY